MKAALNILWDLAEAQEELHVAYSTPVNLHILAEILLHCPPVYLHTPVVFSVSVTGSHMNS